LTLQSALLALQSSAMNRRELLKRLSAIPFVSMLAPLLHGQSKKAEPVKELRFANVEDFWAWAKKTQTQEKLAKLEAWNKKWVAPRQQLPEAVAPNSLGPVPVFPLQPKVGLDADGQVVWVTMMAHRVGWPEKSDIP
jgi:hypothetical protein